MSNPGPDEKRLVRHRMSETRDALSPALRQQAAREVARRLRGLPEIDRARVVAGFAAHRSEIDLSHALAALRARGTVVVLPRVSARRPRLRFLRAPEAELVPGPLGLREPAADAPEVPLEAIDVLLMPGLAFDARGGRLGWGGGYYDEAGAAARRGRSHLVGVGYAFQLLAACPVDDRDVAVDHVVTDEAIIRCALAPRP